MKVYLGEGMATAINGGCVCEELALGERKCGFGFDAHDAGGGVTELELDVLFGEVLLGGFVLAFPEEVVVEDDDAVEG